MAALALRGAMDDALRAPASAMTTERSLAVLALAAPGACLRFVSEHADAVRRLVGTRDLSHAIATALRSFDGDAAARRAYAAQIARRLHDVLTAEAAVDVLHAFGTGPDAAELVLFERLAQRFPAEPAVLRAAIAVARARGDDERLDGLLSALGGVDRTPATVAFIRRLRPAAQAASARVRVALLSSYTIDHLVPYVDLACRALGLSPAIYVAPFNSWTRDIIDEASGLRRFEADIVFLSVSIDDLMPELTRSLPVEALDAPAEIALARVLDAARCFTTWNAGKPLVVHSFHSAFSGSLGVIDGRESLSRTQWLARLNGKLADGLRSLPSCYFLDVNDAIAASEAAQGDNPKLRHLAAMRLPPQALAGVADAYARYIAPLKGLTRKCVVVDLDNTLWGGVVGEDGKDGIRLGNASPGSEFVEFQEFLRSLTERGILLAVNSKNNAADALDVFRTHPAMVLRETDFSAMRINWEPKPENMRAIAAELNIGVDSLVFVDDNPDERERMRQLMPDVLTVELPRDPALYRSVLERLPQLQTLAITSDDLQRLEQYRTVRLRERAKSSATNVAEYLQSLGIGVEIGAAAKPDFARIVQLFGKTNQFNISTKRYGASDVDRFASDPRFALWVLRSNDRFGNHGLVALTLVRRDAPVWTIEDFLMSCRVIGYGIETALLAFVAERARESGATALAGAFVETAKNAPAKDLFERHGFSAGESAGLAQRWHFSLERPLDFPAWIERRDRDA